MATQPQEKRRYVVITAVRKQGGGAIVGYFKTTAEMPPDFTHPSALDITDVMASMRLTDLDRCLAIMNSHWKP
jgi:hypothetical protein